MTHTPKKPLANTPERFAKMRDELAEEYAFSSKGNAHDTRRTGFRNGWNACAKALFESSELAQLVALAERGHKVISQLCTDEPCNRCKFNEEILASISKLKSELGE